MNTITIFGKDQCEKCELAKQCFPGAEYQNHSEIFDGRYEIDEATRIVEQSGGYLPIIVVESKSGRLVLGPSGATVIGKECTDGACKL